MDIEQNLYFKTLADGWSFAKTSDGDGAASKILASAASIARRQGA